MDIVKIVKDTQISLEELKRVVNKQIQISLEELIPSLKSVKQMNTLLLSFHFNPTGSHSSSIWGNDYRKGALDAYGIKEDATEMRCMAMGDIGGLFPLKYIKASHIYQKN